MGEIEDTPDLRPPADAVFELIGGSLPSEPVMVDGGWPPPRVRSGRWLITQIVREAILAIRSRRFWVDSAVVLLGSSLAAAVIVAVLSGASASGAAETWPWTYVLAAAILPASASMLAVHWGLLGECRRDQHDDGDLGRGLPLLATSVRGLIFAVLALTLQLVLAALAGASGRTAVAAALAVAVEFLVFGAIGTGVAALLKHPVRAGILGWVLAIALVAGNVAAVWALMPAVRSEDPVTVAINVKHGPFGEAVAYDCAPEAVGNAEIFHTERIMWLAATNPVVIFTMMAADTGLADGIPGWIPAALQSAGDGSQVPCVGGVPLVEDSMHAPLAAIGLALQGTLAALLLAAGQRSARRRLATAA